MNTGINFAGQLGAVTWRDGREHRGPWVIGFIRIHTGGAFLQLRRANTVTMCPIDIPGPQCHWRELLTLTTAGS